MSKIRPPYWGSYLGDAGPIDPDLIDQRVSNGSLSIAGGQPLNDIGDIVVGELAAVVRGDVSVTTGCIANNLARVNRG